MIQGTPDPIITDYIVKKNPKYIYKKHQNIGLVLLDILPLRLQCAVIKLLLK